MNLEEREAQDRMSSFLTVHKFESQLKEVVGDLFFTTGSRQWSLASRDSDWDIVVPTIHRKEVFELFSKVVTVPEIVESEYNNGFKGIIDGLTINIIPLHHREFLAWAIATNQMQEYVRHETGRRILIGKHRRVATFEKLVACAKQVIPADFPNLLDYKEIWLEQ